jgi:hypothetical protein
MGDAAAGLVQYWIAFIPIGKQKQPGLATRPFLSCSDKVLQR